MKNSYQMVIGLAGFFALAFAGPAEAQLYNWTTTLHPNGFTGGGQRGYNWLFYVTGGLAVTDLYAKWKYTNTDPNAYALGRASASEVKPGSVVGGGIELGITPRWALKAEYLYMTFGTVSTTSAIQAHNSNDGLELVQLPRRNSANLNSSIGRVGVNFPF